jgi:hypothetical protein
MLTTITLNNKTGHLVRNTLRLETSKCNTSKQLTTMASVCSVDGNILQFVMFTDYLKSVIRTDKRATKKNIAEQHQKALNQLSIIMLEAIAHYQHKNMTLDIDCDVYSTTNKYAR